MRINGGTCGVLPFIYVPLRTNHSATMKKDDITTLCTPDFIQEIKRIVTNARQKAYAAINSAMVEAYWQMGKRIVEQEQQGRGRADYGSQLLKSLSKELTAEFGKGFSVNSRCHASLPFPVSPVFPYPFPCPMQDRNCRHFRLRRC